MPCRLALLVFLLASAPRASETPESLVHEKLLAPLAAREKARSSYSRARPPAAERRVRMLDAAPIADAKGGAFAGFLGRRMRQCQAERREPQRCETCHDERPRRGML